MMFHRAGVCASDSPGKLKRCGVVNGVVALPRGGEPCT